MPKNKGYLNAKKMSIPDLQKKSDKGLTQKGIPLEKLAEKQKRAFMP